MISVLLWFYGIICNFIYFVGPHSLTNYFNEDDEVWLNVQEIVEGLSDGEKDILVNELGHKDGVNDWPAFILDGAGALMAQANPGGKIPRASLRPTSIMVFAIIPASNNTYDEIEYNKV